MDEFLYLAGRSIKHFLVEAPPETEKVRFAWVMCLSTQYVQERVIDICSDHRSQSKLFKTMARTRSVVSCALHDITTNHDASALAPSAYLDQAFILHFACRGFYDLMNRTAGRNYQNDKSGPIEEVLLAAFFGHRCFPIVAYPFRFDLYRVELSSPILELTLKSFESKSRAKAGALRQARPLSPKDEEKELNLS